MEKSVLSSSDTPTYSDTRTNSDTPTDSETRNHIKNCLDFYIKKEPVYCISLRDLDPYKLSYLLNILIIYKNISFCHYHFNSSDNDRMLIISVDGYTEFKKIFMDFFNFCWPLILKKFQ